MIFIDILFYVSLLKSRNVFAADCERVCIHAKYFYRSWSDIITHSQQPRIQQRLPSLAYNFETNVCLNIGSKTNVAICSNKNSEFATRGRKSEKERKKFKLHCISLYKCAIRVFNIFWYLQHVTPTRKVYLVEYILFVHRWRCYFDSTNSWPKMLQKPKQKAHVPVSLCSIFVFFFMINVLLLFSFFVVCSSLFSILHL